MGINTFCAYIKLQQLPQDVKAAHKIKVDAKTPRFDITQMAGYYKPIESLKNKDGQVYFYLNETRGIINSPDARRADKFLGARGSLNFSSIYMLDSIPDSEGYLIGYGNPYRLQTHGKDKKQNPFYDNRDDGYLFLIEQDWQTIEILVIPNGCNTILGNAMALQDGKYNDALEMMRATANTFFQY